jgi:hypothetical protein
MLTCIRVTNPFDIEGKDILRDLMEDGLSIRQVCNRLFPGFTEFEHPTLCLVNCEPWMRDKWDEPLPLNSSVTFVRLVGGVTALVIAAVVVVVVAVVLAVVLAPQNPAVIGASSDVAGQQQNGASVYSLSGERNQNRINNSIECVYGRCRLWPSYAAVPYSVYRGNEQFQFSLFCLGHGAFKVEKMQFEDTPIQNFDDVEFQIVNPNGTLTLFADNVSTSAEVADLELYGPNEAEYSGWTGPFVANEPLTDTHKLSVDVSFPRGLYVLVDGDLLEQEIQVLFQYQEINDAGAAIGSWVNMTFTNAQAIPTEPRNDEDEEWTSEQGPETRFAESNIPFIYKRMATLTPQRFTFNAKVPLGRYQVRAQRMNQRNKVANAANVVRWESLKAFFPSVQNYGDVTLVAVKARATNNLNNNAAQRFNVIATRKLRHWTPEGGWSATKINTRSPVWAFCDVFMAKYGGRLPDTFLDLQSLYELQMAYQAEGGSAKFDYIFDQKTTVWEAARAICRVGRGIPMLNGSRLTIIRDKVQLAAMHVFNQHNIVEGSLEWGVKLRNIEDTDGIEVEYMDSTTWLPETVLCLLGTDTGVNPESIKLPGCTSRDLAYQEGLYVRAVQLYIRENITFRTGLEGHLPRYGDLILIGHDVPRWGTSGLVTLIDGTHVHLSEPVTFVPATTHKIFLRKKDGTPYGPVICTVGATPFIVEVDPPIVESFYFDTTHEKPYFLFGVSSLEAKRCTVIGISPEGGDEITVRCSNYDVRVFSFSGLPTPAMYARGHVVQEPAAPKIKGLEIYDNPTNEGFITITWQPTFGAKRYIVEQSQDNFEWVRIETTPYNVVEIRANKGPLFIRVAAINISAGPWVYWNGEVLADGNVVPGNVLNLRLFYIAAGAVQVVWNAVPKADRYKIVIMKGGSFKELRREFNHKTNLLFIYTEKNWIADGLDTDLQTDIVFFVKAVNVKGESAEPAILNVNVIPGEALSAQAIVSDLQGIEVPSDSTTIMTDDSTY